MQQLVTVVARLNKWHVAPILGVALVLCMAAAAQAGPTPPSCPEGQQYVSIAVNGQHCIPVGGGDVNSNIIFRVLTAFLRFLAAGVGLAVTGGIVWAGYLYITARGNASQVEKAKVIIINAVIGLLLFIFMYAILQFLIPGGIFV